MGHFIFSRRLALSNVASVALILIILGCGETEFVGDDAKRAREASQQDQSESTPEIETPPESFSAEANAERSPTIEVPEIPEIKNPTVEDQVFNVAWDWQCVTADAPLAPAELEESQTLFSGAGPHTIATEANFSMNLDIRGQICQPANLPREIVLVVDVSGSMGGNDGSDPLTVDCGRKTAIKALLDSLKLEKNATVGLITFDDIVIVNSTVLMTPAEFEVLHLKDDELCISGNGTNYVEALDGAQALLATGSALSKKEIFFITDGLPNDLDLSAEKAAEVRATSTIATIMLGDADDAHLKNNIASKGAEDIPLFANAMKADELALALSFLAVNEVVSGMIKYRALGQEEWTEHDLLEASEDYEFSLDRFTFDKTEFPTGLEFEYNYIDKFGAKTINSGKLTW